jgi:hypothetical protein
VDKGNNIWVGFWNTKNLLMLKNENGTVLAKWTLSARPYGLAIDADQMIWISSRDPCVMLKVSPISGELKSWSPPSGCGYGITVDPFGKVWQANWEAWKVNRFDPSTNSWSGSFDAPWARGVAASVERDASGKVVGSKIYVAGSTEWSSCAPQGIVSVIDAKTLKSEAQINLGANGRCPVGVAIDIDGYVWSVNWGSSNASKVDPKTKQPVGVYPVGANPYTYSDMTGYAAKSITAPSGYYREIFTGWTNATTTWTQLFVAADLPGSGKTYLKVSYRVADTLDALKTAVWIGPAGPFPPQSFPMNLSQTGMYLEVEVTLQTDDPAIIPTLKGITVMATGK